MATSRYRVPAMPEQHVLEHVRVRLIDPDDAIERDRYRSLIEKHHYLKSDTLVGEQLADDWRRSYGHPKACATLRAACLPAGLQHVEDAVIPRADLTMVEIRRLLVLCRQVPDWRAKKGKDYSLQCLLSIMVMATLAGAARGQRDLAAFAQGLNPVPTPRAGQLPQHFHDDMSRFNNRHAFATITSPRR